MSPSEAEVDFTQSQEPMIPPVICQGSKAITIHRSSGRSFPPNYHRSSSPSLIQ